MLPSLDSLAAMASAAAAEAAAAVQERDRVPDPVLGWYGDGETMRVSMPGALIKSHDGTRFFTVPIANAVKRNADGVKVRVAEWAASDSPLRDAAWIKQNCGDAMLKFLPGKLPGSSTARLGLATVVNGGEYTVDAPAAGGEPAEAAPRARVCG